MNGDNQSFFAEQQRAVERMRESAARSRYASLNQKEEHQSNKTADKNVTAEKPDDTAHRSPQSKDSGNFENILSRLDIPILNRIKSDGDTAVILGLLLLLTAEKSDRLLLLALMYILL